MALVSTIGEANDLEGLGNFLESDIIEPLGRVDGVAEVTVYGGGSREMRIFVDPDKLVQYRLTLTEVIDALRSSSTMMSVGVVNEGKRTYAVWAEAVNYTPQTASRIVLRTDVSETGTLVPLLLSDVATISLQVQERTSFRRLMGEDAIIINVLRAQGTNVVETMKALALVVDDLNTTTLAARDLDLSIVYDETKYISSAIDLVQQNIWIGGVLALLVLLLFLRSALPTIIVFAAIPVSVIGTFVAIAGLGLSINVISLAGLAFAVGMVVDASIVSLENIFRLRQRGMSAENAAYHGARQVWAPILGSALTTVIVFVPVLMLQLPVGQLFRDIGIAISVAVLISVVVSVTVIPALASRMLRGSANRFGALLPIPPGLDHLARGFAALILRYATFAVRRRAVGLVVVGAVLVGAGGFSYRFMPQLDYLPDGNANFVFGRIFVPPGYSMDETVRIAEKMESAARPLWEEEAPADGPPAIERFFVAFSGGAFAGASAVEPSRVAGLQSVLMTPIFSEPGAGAFVCQSSLFGRSVGGSRSIRLDVSGPDRDTILPIAYRLNEALSTRFSRRDGNQIRAIPSLDNGAPQIRIRPI